MPNIPPFYDHMKQQPKFCRLRMTNVNTTDPVQTRFLKSSLFSIPGCEKFRQSRSRVSVNGLSGLPHSFLMNPIESLMCNGPWIHFNPEILRRKLIKCTEGGRRDGFVASLRRDKTGSRRFPLLGRTFGLLLSHVSLLTDIVFQEATGCLHLSSELRGMIEFSCCGC